MTDDPGLVIRPAEPADRPRILELVRAAFAGGPGGGDEEVDIVEQTWARAATCPDLELVAVLDGEVVGHVLGAWADLGGRAVPAVAPLAVDPAHQGVGVGSALMIELIDRADRAGHPLVVLLGAPAYYGRFGFEPSGPLGVSYPPVGADSPHFQVRRLAAYSPDWVGAVTYCWEGP